MARPATEAAAFVHFPLRIPKELMDVLRMRAAESGAPINTEMVRALQRDVEFRVSQVKRKAQRVPS